MKAKVMVIAAALVAALAGAGSAGAVPGTAFVSPSRNIVCVYATQFGIGCKTVSNGQVAILRAFTGRVSFRGTVTVGNRYAARVISYGRTVTYGGTFRVASSEGGFDVWSTLTGAGFHIDRDNVYEIS